MKSIMTNYYYFFFVFCFLLIKRYKDRFFNTALRPQIRRLFSDILGPATAAEQQLGEERSAVSGSEPPQKAPRIGLHAMYAELLAEDGQHEAAAHINTTSSQITLYLSEPVIPDNEQPLDFWKANERRFPALAQAARSYLCSPCTSVDSERLFSTAGLVMDEKRSRLTAKNAEMLIFSKANLPFMLLNQK